ncbi:MAG: DUF805 domain-containing protein [SAR324 cluster bacterium]|uniref:DUF805 domain-containing protein n=1 Tax=SAR324 cluster bacterium TaxID=2024889 RepID=A0A7X9FU91_9DELT|nr:DUF805 domain-containing protein [SAR324 cluster bacterium]
MADYVFLRKITTLLFLSLLIISPDLCSAQSDVYKYKDDKGHTYYVSDLDKIPEQYRKKITQPHSLPTIVREQSKSTPKLETKDFGKGFSSAFESKTNIEEDTQIDSMEEGVELSNEKKPGTVWDSFSKGFVRGYSKSSPPEDYDRLVKVLRSDIGRKVLIVTIVISLINIIAMWILLERRGLPGFGVVIPIYNLILISNLAGKSGWWVLWFLLPGIGGIIWSLSVNFCIAKNFGKGDLFAVGTAILPFLFFPIMAFSGDR